MTAGFEFDVDEVFGDDYLHFYADALGEERSRREADLIVRLLGLEMGMRVLDVPCGHGRIANRLAAFGCRVTGVDRTARFLEVAGSAESSVEYRLADMREYTPKPGLDAIINWFTSFGYFDDDTNRSLLARWRRGLRPGGKLLIELQNRQHVLGLILSGGGSSNHVHQKDDDLLVDRTTFDPLTGRMRTERISIRDGRARRYRWSVRTFAFTELRGWLLDVGFAEVAGHGAEGEPLSLASRRMLVVATA